MGGWCASRNKCQHYYVHSKVIVERLCGKLEEPESIKEKPNDALQMRWIYQHSGINGQ
jgi:hypothetical protein